MKLITLGRLIYTKLFDRRNSERASFTLAERFATLCYPKISFSGFGRTWLDDEVFFSYYRQFVPHTRHTADRKFFLRSLLQLIEQLPGDTAECGAWEGASSWLICDKFKDTTKTHFVFDSCDGLSEPESLDGDYWASGDLRATEETLKSQLSDFPNARILRGWIPERFGEVAKREFCFVHIDVDLYQPTSDSLSFFYPRMVCGGVILFDDYGFIDCPGATAAVDELMRDKPEKIIHVPTGQAFIIRR